MTSAIKKVVLLEAKLIAFAADRVHHMADSFIQNEVEHSAGYEEFVTRVRDTVATVEQKLSAPLQWITSLPGEVVKTVKHAGGTVSKDVERLHERLQRPQKVSDRGKQQPES